MITIINSGYYQLFETREKTKILVLGKDSYRWTSVNGIAELINDDSRIDTSNKLLCSGQFKLFDVKDELHLTSVLHLELANSEGRAQVYLLLTGLPFEKGMHKRIVPTIEKVRQVSN